MTKSAGVEYAPHGIRINAVCPGTIDTPMVQDMLKGQSEAMKEIVKEQSIGRLGRADEVAAAVLWLCTPGASFVIGVGRRSTVASLRTELRDRSDQPSLLDDARQVPAENDLHALGAASNGVVF